MNKHLTFLAVIIAISLGGLAFAQNIPNGIDLDAMRQRAAEYSEEAQALASDVRKRAEALTQDAQDVKLKAQTNRASYADGVTLTKTDAVLDFDAMIADQAQAEKAMLGKSPRFIAFVSLSMPPSALKVLVHDMTRAGGITVLRGFPQGNSEAFKKRLAAIWRDSNEAGSLGIDPRLFRAFQIKVAPTFIMLSTDFTPCDGFDCTSNVPPHDRIEGNISVEKVLDTFVSGGGAGAQLASLYMNRLQGDQR